MVGENGNRSAVRTFCRSQSTWIMETTGLSLDLLSRDMVQKGEEDT